ncbi:MAG: T9SS type A sorting domain-containing protein [Flavobacteriales bacterium]|nr:T9SS type A sorting domain-containing protein [Flavobacteriales bacterium]
MRSAPAILILAMSPSLLHSQATLVPVWSHTWPYGQDPETISGPFIGSSQDNHVAVDPITGSIHVTIDDQLELNSPHFDHLFTFAPDGTDNTPSPVPLLGTATTGEGGEPENIESTRDLVVRNGIVYHQRELNLGFFSNGTAGSICARNAAGEQWRVGLGRNWVDRGMVLVDGDGVVAVRPVAGNIMTFVDPEGWPERLVPDGGSWTIRDAALAGNEVLGLTDGELLRFDRSTGTLMGPPVPLFTNGTGHLITSDGQHVIYVYSPSDGGILCASADVEGNVLWEVYLPEAIDYTELELDTSGRPWLTGDRQSGGDAPMLVVIGADGGAFWTFTYGATMNDLAMGNGQAYITGRLTNGDNSTYLIAVSTEITVGEPVTEAPVTGLTVYPSPASSTLHIAGGSRILLSRVFDATGQEVQATMPGNGALDVSGLVPGVYFLQATTASGLITRRFAVAR